MNYYDDYYNSSPATNYPHAKSNTMPNVYSPMMQMDQNPLPALPSGIPGGGLVGQLPSPQSQAEIPIDLGSPQSTIDSIQFVAGFLRTMIGRNMRVEFLIGTNGPLVDRIGTLKAVGTSYIILQPVGSREIIMCDLYSIKFVTVFPPTIPSPQPY